MPAHHLNEPLDAKKFTVVGSYAPSSKIVRHVGMLTDAGKIQPDLDVQVFESGPSCSSDCSVDTTARPFVLQPLHGLT